MENKLQTMRQILRQSTKLLCESLKPADVLRNLKAEEVLTPDEARKIRAKATDADRVELLLEILERKPITSYVTFMEVLKTERGDLHRKVKALERKNNFDSGNDQENFPSSGIVDYRRKKNFKILYNYVIFKFISLFIFV